MPVRVTAHRCHDRERSAAYAGLARRTVLFDTRRARERSARTSHAVGSWASRHTRLGQRHVPLQEGRAI